MKVKVYVSTNKVGSGCERVIEIPDEDLEDLEENERDKIIDEYAIDEMYNLISWGWEIVE